MKYGLKRKKSFDFICISSLPKEFNGRINEAFYRWKGLQGKGNNKTKADFLKDYHAVKITIEDASNILDIK